MNRLCLVLFFAVAVTACTGADFLGTTPDTSNSPTPTPGPASNPPSSTTTSTTAGAPDTTSPLGDPVALVAPSGVPVVITGVSGDTFEVLTPCGDAASLGAGTPIYDVDVVIDPGHGGPIDTGAVAPTGLEEKEVNLRVSLAVHRILAERGIATMLTRAGDYPIPITTRAAYADMVGARALVSIHHNSPTANPSERPGVEIFVQSDTPESMRLGGLLYESTMAALDGFDVAWASASDAGVMTVHNLEGLDAYGMIRRPETVTALIEMGYVSNRPEAELHARPVYVETAAAALADAIERFLTTDAPGTGFVEGRVFTPGPGVGADQCIEPDLERSLYPDVIGVDVEVETPGIYSFEVTISSPYDDAERYADGFRVVGSDGVIYASLGLTHDHATEQPFTRELTAVEIPAHVDSVRVEARDLTYGWGGASIEVDLP